MKTNKFFALAKPIYAISTSVFIALVILGWSVYGTYRAMNEIIERDMRLVELIGLVTYYDEYLTMSVHVAAYSGDVKWEDRYEVYVDPIYAVLDEINAITPIDFDPELSVEMSAANQRLVDLEMDSLPYM